MASDYAVMETLDFHAKMASYPCMFNMQCYDHPVRNRLKGRMDWLRRKLDDGFEDKEEVKKIQNTLTRIYYQLGLHNLATAMNESVLIETQYGCIVALGNCIFMDWLKNGKVSNHYLRLLDDLKEKPGFEDKVLTAKSEQAYYLGILGNMCDLIAAIKVYEEILDLRENDNWRYSLALVYGRLRFKHGIEKYSGKRLNQAKCQEKAKECFQKVAASSDMRLKALGIAYLTAQYSEPDSDILSGVENAYSIYPNSSDVCLVSGKRLIYIDPAKAVFFLEKAVELNPKRCVSHHQLALAYERVSRSVPMERTEEIQEKAHQHFQLAYETSNRMYIASLLDLARFFQRQDKKRRAEDEAQRFISSRFAGLQVSIPLLKVHTIHFHLGNSEASYPHLLLSLLISIANMKAKSTAEENYAVWSRLFVTHANVDVLGKSANKLCNCVDRHRDKIKRVFQPIDKFVSNGRIGDPDAIISEAKDIRRDDKKVGHNEEALLFLELVSMRPRMDILRFRDDHIQLLKTEASQCLEKNWGIASMFFRQAFDLIFSKEEVGEEDMESDSDLSIIVDMVVLFKNTSTLCADTAYGLEDAISTFFDLKVAFNPILNAISSSGQDGALAEFVNEHETKVIMVVFESDGAETQYLMEKVAPFLEEKKDDSKSQRPTLALVQCYDQPALYLPNDLKNLPCLSLGQDGDEFPNLFCQEDVQCQADKSVTVKDVLGAYFQGNTRNVMKLFNHLTRHSE